MEKHTISEGRFMVAAGAIIEHVPTGKILLLKRTGAADFAAGVWEDPSGKVKQFEDLEAALRREIEEETEITDLEIVKPLTTNHFFRGAKTAAHEVVLIIYWCRTNTEAITISGEHEEFLWLAPKEALQLTNHPGVKRDVKTFMRERGSA